MHGFGRADTKQDSQNLRIGYPLSQRRVDAGTTLFNEGKVKSRRKSNRLEVPGNAVLGWVRTVLWCRYYPVMPSDSLSHWADLTLGKRKRGIEIGIFVVGAVTSPKTGVHVKLREVCEPILS